MDSLACFAAKSVAIVLRSFAGFLDYKPNPPNIEPPFPVDNEIISIASTIIIEDDNSFNVKEEDVVLTKSSTKEGIQKVILSQVDSHVTESG
ncbi:hypothetical protein ACA910_004646 [Epithemia clementina (nom. ined.)]